MRYSYKIQKVLINDRKKKKKKKSDKNKEAWTTLNEFISLWFRLCSNGDSAVNWFWEKRRV